MMIRKVQMCALATLVINSFLVFAANEKQTLPMVERLNHSNVYAALERRMPALDKAYVTDSPLNQNDGIEVGKLDLSNDKMEAISAFAEEIADGKHGKYDSLLIAHKGKLAFESYYRRGRVNLPHGQASTTKSYLSLAIGRAIELGYLAISDLDKPFISFIKGLDLSKIDDAIEKITPAQLLSMQSGLKITDEQLNNIKADKKLSSNLVQSLLERTTLQQANFDYKGTDTRLAMQLLNAVVPGSVNDFINNEVFAKLGINNYGWSLDVNGTPRGYNGSSMTSRNMLKIGNLIANNGKWKGEQLVSVEYLEKATSKVAKATDDWIFEDTDVSELYYGYYIWSAQLRAEGKSYVAKFPWGGGGQYILTIDELDLVIVITGHDRNDLILPQVAKKLLHAFII